MKLSIIIPVYNVEKYIENTLKSIFNQQCTEDLFEVIIVNDGTPDNSMQIVEKYTNSHNNITIINQTNQGLSCARNSGLQQATGEYIWFVDSDDTLENNSINQIIKLINNNTSVDIWGFNILKINELTKESKIEQIIFKQQNKLYNKNITISDIIHKSHIAPAQRFIFKHQFLKKNNLLFYPHIYHEDVEFMAKALFLASTIRFIDYAPYKYLVRSSGNIMSAKGKKSMQDKLIIISNLQTFQQEQDRTLFNKCYFDDMIFFMAKNLIKYAPKDFLSLLKPYKNEFRRIAINGFLSNLYFKDIKKCISAILLFAYSYKKNI